MSVRPFAFVLSAVLALPPVAPAGPIEFTLGAGNLTTSADAPQLGMALVPGKIPDWVFATELNSPQSASFGVVAYEPWHIPTPAPRDVHPDGTTHWNNEGYFTVDVSLTDYASGERATLPFHGRAHMYSHYEPVHGWNGYTVLWFDERKELTLGGNAYTVWGANRYTEGYGVVNVWVGSGAPVSTPEPGTFALAALGLAPLALRRFRRK